MEHRSVIHGCLVEISGIGVIITGESGVGKTTVCLELDKCGHDLIADDSVALSMQGGRVFGNVPSETSGMIAIRGVGVIDRSRSVSVRKSKSVPIDLVVELVAMSSCTEDNITTVELLIGIPFVKLINSHPALTARAIESHVSSIRK